MKSTTKIDTKLTKGELDTIRAMITYMLTEDTDMDDKFIDKMFNLEEKFDRLALQLN